MKKIFGSYDAIHMPQNIITDQINTSVAVTKRIKVHLLKLIKKFIL